MNQATLDLEKRLMKHPRASRAAIAHVEGILDNGSWQPLHAVVALLLGATVLFDGGANQAIGYALPGIATEFHTTPSLLSPLLGSGLAGMAIGSICAGVAADRIGRRPALAASVFAFGAATLALAFAPNLFTIGILRFFVGLGVGGALPCATTLVSEFMPRARRAAMIALTILCVPLGGMSAGIAAELLIPSFGWRGLHVAIGGMSLLVGSCLLICLSESPRFLSRRRHRYGELSRILTKLGQDLDIAALAIGDGEPASDVTGRNGAHGTVEVHSRRDTAALYLAFFSCLFVVYSAFNWLPAFVSAEGGDSTSAARSLTAFNLGGVIGTLLCASMIVRLGSRRPQIGFAVSAAMTATCLALISFTIPLATAGWLLLTGMGVFGLFVNGLQSSLFALAAYIFPTRLRARGTAGALTLGFLGAIVSSLTGGALIAHASLLELLFLLSIAMIVTAAGLGALTRSIPATKRLGGS